MSTTPRPITHVRKRDGSLQPFDPGRIERAIAGAMSEVGPINEPEARRLATEVIDALRTLEPPPAVEQIQDVVERVLAEQGHPDVAKAYILYRRDHTELREAKSALGVRDDLKLTVNAAKVLQARYLMKNEKGLVIETPRQMMQRVAHAVAGFDDLFGDEMYGEYKGRSETEFADMLTRLEFLPNSPTLMNAGTPLGQLAACFVLPVGDSMSEIFEAVRHMALIHQSGGGTGFSFSRLRPAGDVVRSTGGIASGPVSFMSVFDTATNVIKQGGRRRGANMAILRVDHPDIVDFITVKAERRGLQNFNLSVAVPDAFMAAVRDNKDYDLINPRTREAVGRKNARDIFDLITTSAWRCGDPGLVFIDAINRDNPTPQLGEFEATNPCGEQPLLPYESCNLGSINVAALVEGGQLQWDRLERLIPIAVHFLDNVCDGSRFPLPQIEQITRANRKIGLGLMGFAEVLIKLGIPYDSEEGVAFGEKLMKFVNEKAHAASVELAHRRRSFDNFKGSLWERRGYTAMRNATVTTIAPTGTISMIAGVSSGIEPLFALSYFRNVLGGARLMEQNVLFEQVARSRGFYSKELMTEIARRGSVRGLKQVPDDVQRVFVTAFDVAPEWHVRMQAAFQKHTDNSVSKTVNLPSSATPGDVRRIYLLAYSLKCKGITIYRYGSVPGQVLQVTAAAEGVQRPVSPDQVGDELAEFADYVTCDAEFSGECRECAT